MGLIELICIAVGLSMDAFAVAICKGLSLRKCTWQKQGIVGLYFGVFQAGMPLLGYLLGMQFKEQHLPIRLQLLITGLLLFYLVLSVQT